MSEMAPRDPWLPAPIPEVHVPYKSCIETNTGRIEVADFSAHPEENRRLILKAWLIPEMVEALRNAVGCCETESSGRGVCHYREAVRTVLAKYDAQP